MQVLQGWAHCLSPSYDEVPCLTMLSLSVFDFPCLLRSGEHSKIFDSNGMDTNKRRSIAGFGKKAKRIMKADPTYNLFLYGISDENQEFLGKPATDYADTFISNLLYSPSSAPVAPDAMVAVTIWMQVIHSLHSAHAACNRPSFVEEESTGDGGPSQDDDSGLYIDEAAAYWIGDDQAATGSSKGHLLYALTESIGSQFEDIPEGAESEINTKIIDLFNQVSAALFVFCSVWLFYSHAISNTIMFVYQPGKKSHCHFSGLHDEL